MTTESLPLGARPLPEVFPLLEDAIVRVLDGAAIDLTTEHEVVVKYLIPAAAVRGVRAAFRRDPAAGWRIELRPRPTSPSTNEGTPLTGGTQ